MSDARAAAAEDLQFTLGEGPAIEASRSGRAVFEPDLTSSERFPNFAPEAIALGLVAAFALPLQVGAARLGALDLYSDRPGDLEPDVVDDACLVADMAALRVLGEQSRTAPGDLPPLVHDMVDARAVVHQATAVVAVQLDIDLDDALLALRARAYAESRSINEVATDVVARTIRFDA